MKNYMNVTIAALGLIIASGLIGNAIKNRNKSQNTISVTGLGTKKFTSDLITWSASFSKNDYELKTAYDGLAQDRAIIQQYLVSKGIKPDEMVFSAVDIEKQFTTVTDDNGATKSSTFAGYKLNQTVSIQSKEVNKVENLSRSVSEIINKGIELTSSSPQYYYTKLSEVKQELIAKATADAKQRAEKIAENADSGLGNLKKGTMGVFQITAPNSNEDYSYGGTFNTDSKEKEASITIKLEYGVD